MAKPFEAMNGDLGYGELRPGTGIKGGGTGKWVKWWAELPELGVIEIVEGKLGGAEPPKGDKWSKGVRESPADLVPYSCFTSTSCLKLKDCKNMPHPFPGKLDLPSSPSPLLSRIIPKNAANGGLNL